MWTCEEKMKYWNDIDLVRSYSLKSFEDTLKMIKAELERDGGIHEVHNFYEYENGTKAQISIDLPGVKKSDVKIVVEKFVNYNCVKVTSVRNKCLSAFDIYCKKGYDVDNATATLEDGVLTITALAKKEKEVPRQIVIT